METQAEMTNALKTKIKSLTAGNPEAMKKATMFEEDKNENKKPEDFLINPDDMNEILKIVKNKKLSGNKIKSKIKEFLKNPDNLKPFLYSIIENNKRKNETKEATSSGGSVGAYEAPLFTKMETKEATTTSSVGSYDAPGFQDVKMKGNTTKGKGGSWKKTQIPGGKFVEVKKKCKRFPYCNQGDINALRIFENETLQKVINQVSKKLNLHEDFIVEIIYNELRKRPIK
jgi:hypothetical protein